MVPLQQPRPQGARVVLRWYTVIVDCHDIAAQARWWARVLDWQIIYEDADEVAIIPKDAPTDPLPADRWTSVGPGMEFVTVPESKAVKNRLHIDLAPHLSDDRDAEVDRLLAMGATRIDVGQGSDMGPGSAVSWTVLADPEGNEFCVLSARDR